MISILEFLKRQNELDNQKMVIAAVLLFVAWGYVADWWHNRDIRRIDSARRNNF